MWTRSVEPIYLSVACYFVRLLFVCDVSFLSVFFVRDVFFLLSALFLRMCRVVLYR